MFIRVLKLRTAAAPAAIALMGLTFFAPAASPAEESGRPRAEVVGSVVDEEGRPVAGAAVTAAMPGTRPEATTTAQDGSFRIPVPLNSVGWIITTLLAAEGDRLGTLPVQRIPDDVAPVTITVRPARPLEVRIVDSDGAPVEGADVHFVTHHRQLLAGKTDAGGRWARRVPADPQAWAVYALKSKVGFDYARSERARGSADPPLALPDRLTLTLDGARPPLRLKAVDHRGRPLAGVKIGPARMTKPGRESDLNGIHDAFVATDAEGSAVIDWLPARLDRTLILRGDVAGRFLPNGYVGLRADGATEPLTLELLPMERLSGRVLMADGKPAAGATVAVSGRGAWGNGFVGQAVADADGLYGLNVDSEHAYIVAAKLGDRLASPPRSGVIVRAGGAADGIDLVLGPATRVTGRVKVGEDALPAAGAYVSATFDAGPIPDELMREGVRTGFGLTMNHWTSKVDARGVYALRLGPGEYRLAGPARVDPVNLTIPSQDPPAEIVRDFHMPRAARGRFTATVVDEAGKPIAGAIVEGAYRTTDGLFRQARAGEDGVIHVDRRLDPLVLYASTTDRTLAGVVRVDERAAEATIVVKPTATASGRLTDPSGSPIVGRAFRYGVRVLRSDDRFGPVSHNFGGATTTDAEGRFELRGLVVGEKYELIVDREDGRKSSARSLVGPSAPGPFDAGDVVVDVTPRKPYVPPTPAERAERAFIAQADRSPREALADVLAEAKREYTRPMLLLGVPKDPTSAELFRLFEEPSPPDEWKDGRRPMETPGDLRWDFELSPLAASRDDVKAFAKDLGVPADGPLLAVLDADGGLAATYPLRTIDGKLAPGPLAAFLREHRPPTRDAEAMLSEGLEASRAEDRRVFLIFSASWCAPCRSLARFIDAHHDELSRHYVFVKLDVSRDDHVPALRDRYQGKDAVNGVPWYVILDATGRPLVTSNRTEDVDDTLPMTNIGFPSAGPGIDHLMDMLKQTAPRLSADALDGLRRDLRTRQ